LKVRHVGCKCKTPACTHACPPTRFHTAYQAASLHACALSNQVLLLEGLGPFPCNTPTILPSFLVSSLASCRPGMPVALLGHQVAVRGVRPVFPRGTPEEYQGLARACWSACAEDRCAQGCLLARGDFRQPPAAVGSEWRPSVGRQRLPCAMPLLTQLNQEGSGAAVCPIRLKPSSLMPHQPPLLRLGRPLSRCCPGCWPCVGNLAAARCHCATTPVLGTRRAAMRVAAAAALVMAALAMLVQAAPALATAGAVPARWRQATSTQAGGKCYGGTQAGRCVHRRRRRRSSSSCSPAARSSRRARSATVVVA
jgi:hypothetical protein